MAFANTTLSSAVALTDNVIVVASAASVAAGRLVLIDQEVMQVTQGYVSGTTVPVLRGRDGSATAAHVVTAAVKHGLASDFALPAPQTIVTYAVARPVQVTSTTATTLTLTLPPAGTDMRVIVNSTSAATITIPVPTKDMDGTELWLVSTTVAAHVPTFTGGLGGVGSGYTALTVAAGAQLCIHAIAAGGTWNIPSAPAWTGTVTKVTGGIA